MVDQVYHRLGSPRQDAAARARFLVAVADGVILQTLLAADPPCVGDIVRPHAACDGSPMPALIFAT